MQMSGELLAAEEVDIAQRQLIAREVNRHLSSYQSMLHTPCWT